MTEFLPDLSAEIDRYMRRLFPITRSITGPGNRETLRILQELVPISIKEYPSGASVYDWVIPDEWQIRDAWVKDGDGNKIVDFQKSNLHVVSYSRPVHTKLVFEEAKERLHTHADLPEAIPYRTTYYKYDWGFCMTQEQYQKLEQSDGELEFFIDSEFNPNGSLTIGEVLIPGKLKEEILISTYCCHPSLANDNLSGAVMTAFLARKLLEVNDLRYSYRIIWVPETIGAIAYSAMNEKEIKATKFGFVVTTVGGKGVLSYKQSWNSRHPINRYVEEVFTELDEDYIKYPFDIHGSDERQFSSQGFRINMVTIAKDKYYEYPEYHTSLDNLDLVRGCDIEKTLSVYFAVILKVENSVVFENKIPHCEVMLSRRDLYPKNGGAIKPEPGEMSEIDAFLWVLFLADGQLSTVDIASQLEVDHDFIINICLKLEALEVIEKV